MNLRRLRAFLVLSRTSHLRRAAELLEQSPAALSKSMHLLEEELGFPLVVPKGRGLELTEEGRALAKRLEPALGQLESVLQPAPKPVETPPRARLRLATFEIFSTHVFSRLVQAGLGAFDIDMREMGPGALEVDVKRKQSDLGLTYLPVPTAGVDFHRIAEMRMGVFGLPEFAGSDWQTWPFVVPISAVSGAPTSVKALDGWPDDTRGRRIQFRVSLMESALELCRAGAAVAFLPAFVVGLQNASVLPERRLVPLPLPFQVPHAKRTAFLVMRGAVAEDATAKRVARAVRLAIKEGEQRQPLSPP